MIVRAIDDNNDWTFGKGKNNYKSGLEAIIQNVKTRLQSWKKDCFFALNDGVDYKSFLSVNTRLFLESDIKRVTLQTQGVMKIIEYSSSIDEKRKLSTQMTIITIYGLAKITV